MRLINIKNLIHNNKLLLFFLILSFLLLSHKITTQVMFIGDFGWFYLQARDSLLSGQIPLVSIPSSHPWLHQGPYWTYLLAGALWVGNFHPLSGVFLSMVIGVISVGVFFCVAKKLFGEHIAMISTFFFVTSPLIVIHLRMPYHTQPIALCTTLYLLFFYKMLKGERHALIGLILSLVALYNFELATTVLIAPVLGALLFGVYRKQSWVKNMRSKSTIATAGVAGFIASLPILLYDFTHGFPQTLKFVAWIGYRILLFLKIVDPLHPHIKNTGPSVQEFSSMMIQRFIFLPNLQIALLITVIILAVIFMIYYRFCKDRSIQASYVVLGLSFCITVAGYIFNRTPSEAYMPVLFPILALFIGIAINYLKQKKGNRFILLSFVALCILNVYSVLRQNFLLQDQYYGYSLAQRQEAADKIIDHTEDKKIRLRAIGDGSQFESMTMSYEYLLWYKGAVINDTSNNIFTIDDAPDKILIRHDKRSNFNKK